MRDISILGVGSARFGRHGETAVDDLAADVARDALADAGVEPERVDALYLGNFMGEMLTGQEALAGLVGEAAGLAGNVPCTKVEGACRRPAEALWLLPGERQGGGGPARRGPWPERRDGRGCDRGLHHRMTRGRP